MQKVKVNSLYTYVPVLIDIVHGLVNAPINGATVRVINLSGCPKANTMGHCYIESLDGIFHGLCCVNSLQPSTEIN